MIIPCPRCLSPLHVRQRPGHLPLCQPCHVVFRGDPGEQAIYAQWRREQEQTQ